MKRYLRSLAMLLAVVLFVSPILEVRAEGENSSGYAETEYAESEQISADGGADLNQLNPDATPGNVTPTEPIRELIVKFLDKDGKTWLRSMDVSDNDAARETVTAALPDEEYLTGWVQNGYLITGWKDQDTGEIVSGNDIKTLYTKIKDSTFGKAATFIAQYSDTPYAYRINYHLDYSYLAGSAQTKVEAYFSSPGQVKDTFTVLDEFVPEKPVASGYHFAGWYTDSARTEEKRIEKIVGKNLARSGRISDLNKGTDLYVKLLSVNLPEAPVIAAAKDCANKKNKTLEIVFTSLPANADGVRLEVATNSGFSKNLDELELTPDEISARKVTLYQVPQKTLYFRASGYVKDSTGNKCYGANSNTLKKKITKGVTEVTASSKMGKISALNITDNTETGQKELKITASVSKRLKSGDFSYYLVRLDPRTYKVTELVDTTWKAIAASTKQTFNFTVSLYDEDGKLDMDRVNGIYAMAVLSADYEYKLISAAAYVKNPEDAYVDKSITATPKLYVSLEDSANIKKAINIHVQIQSQTDVELFYTTDSKWQKYIAKETIQKPAGSVGIATLDYYIFNAPKDATYYFRARTIIRDASGNVGYGEYAYPEPAKIKVKKVKGITKNTGLAETSIKTSRAKITEATILEDPNNKKDHSKLSIKAEVYSRVKSVDGYYYLMTVDEKDNPSLFVGEPVLKMKNDDEKKQSYEFIIDVSGNDADSGPDLLLILAKYSLAVQSSKGKYARISNAMPVDNPELAYADPDLPIPAQPSIDTSTKNVTKVTVPAVPASLPAGTHIQLSISKDEKFVSNLTTVEIPVGETSHTFYNLPKTKYYFRVRYSVPTTYTDPYSMNGIKYGYFSNYGRETISADINGVSEVSISTTAASVKFVSPKKTDPEGTYRIQYTVKKRVKSYDEFYYLVKVNNGKLSAPIEAVPKALPDSNGKIKTSQTFVFHVPLKDDNGLAVTQNYALCVQRSRDKYSRISSSRSASESSTFSVYNFKRYTDDSKKKAKITKKGIQGSTNGSQYFINMYLDDALNGSESYTYKGKTYKFSNPWAKTVASANKKGMMVTGQIMMRYNASKSYMLFPGAGPTAGNPNALYAIYVGNDAAKQEFEAVMFYLAEKLCTEDCHIDNWILGNETNIPQLWANAGSSTNDREAFMNNYAQTFNIMHNAVRCVWRNARCYTCVERTFNDWDTGTQGTYWGSKNFIAMFDQKLKAINSSAEWHVALHPNVIDFDKDPEPWSANNTNNYYVKSTEDTMFITPANLEVFTNHIRNTYGSNHRVILSEIEFTNAAGEIPQAAGLVYSYYKAEFNDMIDAFIVVAPHGVYTLSGAGATAYQYMDDKNWAKTNTYYQRVNSGYTSWNQIIPNFNWDKFK